MSMIPLLSLLSHPVRAYAQIFNGGGLQSGLNEASQVQGLATGSPRQAIINIIKAILNFTALLAVVMIIIAGFYLILSLGNEEQKDKAKRIIYYTLIGLVVILISRILVGLVTLWLAQQV